MKPANRVDAKIGELSESAARPPHRLPADQLFGGQRPASWRRGVDAAFLLLDRDLLRDLRAAAEALGIRREMVVARIAREHLDEY